MDGGTKKKKLISTKHTGNKEFWNIQGEVFFKVDDNNKGLVQYAKESDVDFKTAYDDENRDSTKILLKICETRYLQTYVEVKDKETQWDFVLYKVNKINNSNGI